jgi:hypothetical protein
VHSSDVANLKDFIAGVKSKDQGLLDALGPKHSAEDMEYNDERNTEITRSNGVLSDELARLQGLVDDAKAALDTAEADRAAQETVRIAAEGDYTAKQGALDDAKALQATEVGNADSLSKAEITAANSAFDNEKSEYDVLLAQGQALLVKENALLEQIRSAVAGQGFSLEHKTTHKQVEYCSVEKSKSDAAGTTLRGLQNQCAADRAHAAGGQNVGTACAEFDDFKPSAQAAQEAYNVCISKSASLLSMSEAKSALVMLHSKYIHQDFDYEAAKAQLGDLFNQIQNKIAVEQTVLQDHYAADLVQSTHKRDSEISRSKQAYTDVFNQHTVLVAHAQGVRDDALNEQTKQQVKYTLLEDIKNSNHADHEAALENQQRDGDEARTLNLTEKNAADQRYATNSARILAIKEADSAYLHAELEVVRVIELILAELGLDNEVVTK